MHMCRTTQHTGSTRELWHLHLSVTHLRGITRTVITKTTCTKKFEMTCTYVWTAERELRGMSGTLWLAAWHLDRRRRSCPGLNRHSSPRTPTPHFSTPSKCEQHPGTNTTTFAKTFVACQTATGTADSRSHHWDDAPELGRRGSPAGLC